ncbi:NAD(P)-dependent oxidoreductase [Quadrisphaera oryzae]|uniref:NAD(P)-dependent oxidoreductase n=1 Tax=Quadrisphaera TaxID=317661 RepID=UPI0016486CB6|nr:NAD(P)-dependent oxidoreductase [Quadrisphaera sp. RL12-1S]
MTETSAENSATSTARPAVALLGTGIMGTGMARNIAAAGLPLTVWNRTRERAEPLADVATVAGSPADAVRGADVVVVMLMDADAVLDVLAQAEPGLRDGVVVVQTSTIGPDGTRRVADWAGQRGVQLLDAPVLGTKGPAEQGKLVVLASGPAAAREAARPVLEAVGARAVEQDEVGSGSALKLACNNLVATLVESVAESLVLARALGVDPHLVLEAVRGGAMDSPYVQLKGTAMLEDALDDAAFPLAGAAKDTRLIVEAARAAGVELAVAEAVQRRFAAAVEAGQGSADLAATFRAPR